MIKEHILNELKEARYFSILADEVTDVCNLKQVVIMFRFVDQSAMIWEAFLGLFHCNKGLTGREIANCNDYEIYQTLRFDR